MNKNIIYISIFFLLFAMVNVNADWTTDEIGYWIEHNASNQYTTQSKIWINTNNTNMSFYVYYNGNSINSKNTGNLVFPYFDDFLNNSFNNSISIDNKTGGSLSFYNISINNGIANLSAPSSNKHNAIRSLTPQNCTTVHGSLLTVSGAYGMVGTGLGYFNASFYGWYTPQAVIRTDGYLTHYTAINYNMLTALTGWSNYIIVHNSTNLTGYSYNASTSRLNISSTTVTNARYIYVSVTNTGNINADYLFCSNWNPTFSITTNYGNEETGSWNINGITYTKRKQINTTSNIDVSSFNTGYHIPLDYIQFNNSNISITGISSGEISFNIVSPVSESETFTYETEIDVLLNITNSTEIDVMTYTLDGGSAEIYTTPINLTDLELGEHTLLVWANNTEGETTQTINFTISPYPIDFDINSPMERVYTTQTSSKNILINITNSTYVSSIVYSFNGGTTNITYTNETFTSHNLGNRTIDVWGITQNNIEHKQVNFSVIYSEALDLCDNYFSDSGSYESFTFNGRTFYVYNGEESECQNDILLQFYYRNTESIYVKFYGETETGTWLQSSGVAPTLTIGEWYDENIFEEGYVLEKFASINYNPIIYDKNGNYIQMSGSATFGINTGNYTICVGANCLNMEKPYFKIIYPFRAGYGDYTWRTTNSDWFWNASNVARVNTLPSIYFYTDNDENLSRSSAYYGNMRTGDKYSLNVYKHLTNWNGGDSEIQYGGTGDFYAIWEYPYNSTTGKIRIISSEETDNYEAYILYGGSLITPKWSVYYMEYGNLNPFIVYKRYNPTTFSTTLYSNVATIIKDNNGACYFVPPYTPSDMETIYTLQAYLISCEYLEEENNKIEEIISYPLLPSYINCGRNGNDYKVNITYKENVIYETYITDINNIITYSTLNNKELNILYEITNSTKSIEIKANGKTRCYWDNSETILGLDLGLGDNDLVKQLIGYPLILVAIGLSMVNPFVFVFVFVINDMFSLILIEHIFFIAISVGLMSLVANWNGERNFKTLIILCLLATAYLVQVSSFESDIAGAELTELSTITESIQTLFGGIEGSADLVVIITSVLPTFLLNLIVLILKLPAILISIIFASIGAITPLAITPLRYFEGALIVGAYVFIILKGYEMGRNMFRSV